MKFENKLYNPADQSKEFLIENFVVRTKVFEKLFKDVKNGKMKYPEQHYIIQGQRGMGKTTLLLRLKYEVESTPSLKKWLIPIFWGEETYDVTSLSNVWEKILKYLDNLWNTGGVLFLKTNEFLGHQDYEKKCFDFLIQTLHSKKKKILLLYDNFGEFFLNILSEKETHRLREILMQCADLRIIAASAVVINDTHDYSKPFFEFFKIIYLEGLNKKETLDLIANLQDKSETKIDLEKNKSKIETLAILTGGVIRTVMLIYEVILSDEDGTALHDLEIILDRVTPLYKSRIEALSVQQRKLIDTIAKKWDAVSASEIAANIRDDGKLLQSKLISAQLQQLEKNNFIEKKETKTKNNLYQLKERFFNIWYLMRHGDRNDKCRVIWFTKYLELFYGDNGLKPFIEKHIIKLHSGAYHPGAALFVAKAVVNSEFIDLKMQDLILKETRNILDKKQKRFLPKSDIEILKKSMDLIKKNKLEKALIVLNEVKIKSKEVNFIKGRLYLFLDQYDKAITTLKSICSPETKSRENYFLGLSYYLNGDYSYALEYLSKSSHEFISMAELIVGKIFEKNKDFEKALEHYKFAFEAGNKEATVRLERLFIKMEMHDNAIKYFRSALEKNNKLASFGLGNIYSSLENYEEAKKYFSSSIKNKVFENESYALLGLFSFCDKEFVMVEKYFKMLLESYKAESDYFLNTVSISDSKIMLAYSYYIRIIKKKEAYNLVYNIKLHDITSNFSRLMIALIFLWNNDFPMAFDSIMEFLKKKKEIIDNEYDELNDLFILILAKKQYHFALKLFEMEKFMFKDRFKPVYYALMQYLKDEYPKEVLKMGSELIEPVNDVIKAVEKMEKEYA